MAYPAGSEWRKWDLHVHTPKSHTAHYGPESTSWDRFLSELSSLPSDFKVLGINDYLWVDGYAVVKEAWEAGRLPNLEAVFPVIELRIADFIGMHGKLQRLNAHVIFGPSTDPALITTQFIPRLATSFRLTDTYRPLQTQWNAIPTRDSLADLGNLIKATIPAAERVRYGSDFEEGFNNWVVPLSQVREALNDTSFRERPLLALGKTEWEDIPWGNSTIASKKSIISSVDLVFTASLSPAACTTSVARLRAHEVNHRLLDCSDAHYFQDSAEKDRIGNCSTWVCADPTLAGLRHALLEYDGRIYIGDKPPLLTRRTADPTRFLSRVAIRPAPGQAHVSPSLDVELPLNSGFVVIVGVKGSGKSALLDSIALAGNSHAEKHFSFLSTRRFRNPRNNPAAHFQVELETADGKVEGPLSLATPVDHDKPERLEYLPQALLDELCNNDPGTPDDLFESQLRAIIFSHVPEHQRLGCESLEELLRTRGGAIDHELEQRRAELAEINRSLARLDERLRPSRRRQLSVNLTALEEQLRGHDAAKPPEPVAPPPTPDPAVARATEALQDLRRELLELEKVRTRLASEYKVESGRLNASANILRELDTVRSAFASFVERVTSHSEVVGIPVPTFVRLEVDSEAVAEVHTSAEAKVEDLDRQLRAGGDVEIKRHQLLEKEEELRSALTLPQRIYEQQQSDLQEWARARDRLVGTTTDEGTEAYLKGQIEEIDHLQSRLGEDRQRREIVARQIHESLLSKIGLYRELFRPVQDFLARNALARRHFSLEFAASLEMRDFASRFLSYIDRGKAGSFYGVDPSQQRIERRVELTDPQEWQSLATFLSECELDLRRDRRIADPGTELDSPSDVLRKEMRLEELLDFLYGLTYVEPQYELRSGGQPISVLSPGQKGTLLLMFYLLVDQSGRPIAMDQPDEDLDEHTIYELLRPAIRSARQSRQVLLVTHSPNLAVVGDADQVIVASVDGSRITYISGSIENPEVRTQVVRVLEGTWPAFSDRDQKYRTSGLDPIPVT
ncbi:MAG TPA: hypothetical protein VMW80_00385 [Candidatus Dormibacteraeota bacterium]|nr:hypothetical protein [Candidatus Dormibacteraeota bacterium]